MNAIRIKQLVDAARNKVLDRDLHKEQLTNYLNIQFEEHVEEITEHVDCYSVLMAKWNGPVKVHEFQVVIPKDLLNDVPF